MTNDVQRALAIEAARQLLACYKDAHPRWTDDNTPVDELAVWLELDVETFHPSDQPAGTFGFVDEEGNPIWLCRDLAETLRRFTLAHELGHVVLHMEPEMQPAALRRALHSISSTRYTPADRDDPCRQADIQEDLAGDPAQEAMQDALGPSMIYDPRGEREQIANVFAAELLMPAERVRDLYLDRRVAPETLAKRFNVSNAAMLNRLVSLAEELMGTAANRGEHREDGHEAGEEQAAPSPRTYDEYQQAAIAAPTPALIVAGPGSGKTSTLIGRVEYLVRRMDVAPEHILALTFSRKAAQEMEERVRGLLLGDMHDSEAFMESMPKVSTFHAFCAETLRTYGDRVGLRPDFTLVDDVEGYFVLRRLAHEMRLTQYRNLITPDYYFPNFVSAISRAKDELVTPERYRDLASQMLAEARDDEAAEEARKALEVADVYALYEEELARRQDTDFGGLIMLTVRLLEEHPEVARELQEKYQHILVDEFQDMNRASGILLRLLAGEARRVWVVGDANQAIYSFRGASPANITEFANDYPGAAILPLSRNYRSLPDIVRLSETFRARQLELGEEIESGKNEPTRLPQPSASITLAVAPDNAAEMAGLVEDIRHKHAQGYAYRDIAVLCRTRAQLRKAARALAEAGLPVVEQTALLAQEHIKDALAVVSLLAESSGMAILRVARSLSLPLASPDIETLLLAAREKHVALGQLIYRDEAPPGMSVEGRHTLTRLSSMIQSLSVSATDIWSLLAQYLFIETPIMRDLLMRGGRDAEDGDYMALLYLARRYDQQQRTLREQRQREADARGETIAPEQPRIQAQAADFLDYLRVLLALGQDGSQRGQSSEDEEARADVIRVMTVHASKGLEFPVVYLPNLRQNSFPTINRKSPTPPPRGMIAAERESESGHASGEACLFYVGVTRARDQLVLSYSERNGKQKAKPSIYLDALLEGLPENRLERIMWRGKGERTVVAEGEDEESGIVAIAGGTAAFEPGAAFLDAMRPPELHASALETYLRCPRQYFYSNICGFLGEKGMYQLFWQATQQTLETLKQRVAGTEGEEAQPVISEAEARELYTRHWRELGGPELPFAALYEQHGHEIAALLRDTLLASGDTQWELRPTLTVEVAGRTIHLNIDRVEKARQGEKPARFVRTRMGKRKEKPAASHREYLYAQAYKQHHSAQSLELYFHNLSTGETIPISFTPKKEQRLYEELQESLEAMERNEFPPRPDARQCPACAFFFICPA